MASACVNNVGVAAPESFMDCAAAKRPSCVVWMSPRVSSEVDFAGEGEANGEASQLDSEKLQEDPDPDVLGNEFEFCLEDPVSMLPADELFSGGKLVPLQLSSVRQSAGAVAAVPDVRSEEFQETSHRGSEMQAGDGRVFSRKAPRSASRWKELLRLKKALTAKEDGKSAATFAACGQSGGGARSLMQPFLNRGSKSAMDSSLTLPLLQDVENEALSISSRLSLSSASPGPDPDDHPRLSLDSDKPSAVPRNASSQSISAKVRVAKQRAAAVAARAARNPASRAPESSAVQALGVSIDSPRMNPSGKIVFHGLERSSSSPSSFNGGPRYKHRGMERSYSANLRIAPFLNVPVRSLRGTSKSSVFGFPLFSSQQKKASSHSTSGSSSSKGTQLPNKIQSSR